MVTNRATLINSPNNFIGNISLKHAKFPQYASISSSRNDSNQQNLRRPKVNKFDIRKKNSIRHSQHRSPQPPVEYPIPSRTLISERYCNKSHKQGVFNCRYYNFYTKKQHRNTKN